MNRDKSPEALPRHVAIIMDGNGRWAQRRGLPRVAGHNKGAEAVRRTVTACRRKGIEVLTLFAFSSQNWSRPTAEVRALMTLLASYVESERPTIMDNDIRLTAVGDLDQLPDGPRKALFRLIDDSAGNRSMTLCLALSYGGREEITAMARKLAERAASGDLDPSRIDADTVERAMWSGELGAVDLLIRTSGELRISNFFLWSSAYAEFFFTDLMWPEFSEAALDEALSAYQRRQRRFGKVGGQ